jgi:hypothetical protein
VRTSFSSLGDTLSTGVSGGFGGNRTNTFFTRLSTAAGAVPAGQNGEQSVLRGVSCFDSVGILRVEVPGDVFRVYRLFTEFGLKSVQFNASLTTAKQRTHSIIPYLYTTPNLSNVFNSWQRI